MASNAPAAPTTRSIATSAAIPPAQQYSAAANLPQRPQRQRQQCGGGHFYMAAMTAWPPNEHDNNTVTTPITTKQTCTQVGAGAISCVNQSGYPSNGSQTNSSNTVVTNGYTGDTNNSSSNTTTDSTVDGSHSCHGTAPTGHAPGRGHLSDPDRHERRRTKTGPWNHTWQANTHDKWTGCFMDRQQDNDTSNLTGFPW